MAPHTIAHCINYVYLIHSYGSRVILNIIYYILIEY